MSAVILVIHLILAVAIIGLVLLQRSEGGGLGMGTSGGLGGLASPQATANALTRVTWICVACFFATSLTLGIIASNSGGNKSILEKYNEPAAATAAPAEPAAPAAEPEKSPEPSAPISE